MSAVYIIPILGLKLKLKLEVLGLANHRPDFRDRPQTATTYILTQHINLLFGRLTFLSSNPVGDLISFNNYDLLRDIQNPGV